MKMLFASFLLPADNTVHGETRDIERQMDKVAEGPLKTKLQDLVALVNRLLVQKPKDRKKFYSLHEPAVDCISKD
jgi:IS5 family transposase